MEVSTLSSTFPHPRCTLAHSAASRSILAKRPTASAFFKPSSSSTSSKSPLSTTFLDTTTASCNEFPGHKLRPVVLYPASIKRNVITNVIPFQRGSAWKQPPPDLASYLFRGRIVYLGMSLIPAVTELLMAEFVYLQYESLTKPIFMYINSTGTTKGDRKVGYETEAFAIYDAMKIIKPPIFTLCVGNAWGEAALLLAAGSKGNRAALPSSTIMIKQPIGRFRGQASDVDAARREIKRVKQNMVRLYAKNMNKTQEQIEADIRRPKYFSPTEAVEYGIIDKVLYTENNAVDSGVVSALKEENLSSS